MKLYIFFIVIFAFGFSLVFAHQPQSIDITVSGKDVSIYVSHPVSNAEKHYIRKIEVSVNGREIIEQTFSTQTDNSQEAVYHIPSLKKSDILEVKAYCSRFGELRKRIIVH